MPFCELCEEDFRGPRKAHDTSQEHLEEVAEWEEMMWYVPVTFTKPYHWAFIAQRRRAVVPGITLWELLNHYKKEELADVAKALGVPTRLKAIPFKGIVWEKVNEKADDLESLRGRPPQHCTPPLSPRNSEGSSDVEDQKTVKKKPVKQACKATPKKATTTPSKASPKIAVTKRMKEPSLECAESTEECTTECSEDDKASSCSSDKAPRKKKKVAAKKVTPKGQRKGQVGSNCEDKASSEECRPLPQTVRKSAPAPTAPSCRVCFDAFSGTRGPHHQCTCPYCGDSFCQGCVCGWLLSKIEEPHCPNAHCKKPWSPEFVDSCVYKTWRDSTYREYRSRVLLDRERALLPATQPQAEVVKVQRQTAKEIREALEQIRDTRGTLETLNALLPAREVDNDSYDSDEDSQAEDYEYTYEDLYHPQRKSTSPDEVAKFEVLWNGGWHGAISVDDDDEPDIVAAIGPQPHGDRALYHLVHVLGDGGYAWVKISDTRPVAIVQRDLNDVRAEVAILTGKITELRATVQRLRAPVAGDAVAPKERKSFIRHCPAPECRGFLSTTWKCGMCDMFSCAECQEVKGPARDTAHVCNPDALATARLIAHDTKPCPKCGELITKVDGCDQMFCVMCHTPFCWRTGQVITHGAVHNPHYYEWQRQMNGPGATALAAVQLVHVPCGGLIPWPTLRSVLNPRSVTVADPPWMGPIELAHQRIAHVQDVDLRRLPATALTLHDNEDLRVQYLLKDITEDGLMRTLQTRERKRRKEVELRRIYETLIGAVIDIFHRMASVARDRGPSDDNMVPYCRELDTLRQFINVALDVLRRRYNATFQGFDPNWTQRMVLRMGGKDTENRTIEGILVGAFESLEVKLREVYCDALAGDTHYSGLSIIHQLHQIGRIVDSLPHAATMTRTLSTNLYRFYMNLHYHPYLLPFFCDPSKRDLRPREANTQKSYEENKQTVHLFRVAKGEWDSHKRQLVLVHPHVELNRIPVGNPKKTSRKKTFHPTKRGRDSDEDSE